MTELSSQAQAVLDAAYEEIDYVPQRHVRWAAAAALRAAARQLREAYVNETYVEPADDWLDSIADELENAQ